MYARQKHGITNKALTVLKNTQIILQEGIEQVKYITEESEIIYNLMTSFQQRFKGKTQKINKQGFLPLVIRSNEVQKVIQKRKQEPKQFKNQTDQNTKISSQLIYNPFSLDDQQSNNSKNQLSKSQKNKNKPSENKALLNHQKSFQKRLSQKKKQKTISLQKPLKLGGLGPNIGGNQWQKQKDKRQKMKEFADKVKIVQKITTVSEIHEPKQKLYPEKQKAKEKRQRMKEYAKKVPLPLYKKTVQQKVKEKQDQEINKNQVLQQLQRKHRQYQQIIRNIK